MNNPILQRHSGVQTQRKVVAVPMLQNMLLRLQSATSLHPVCKFTERNIQWALGDPASALGPQIASWAMGVTAIYLALISLQPSFELAFILLMAFAINPQSPEPITSQVRTSANVFYWTTTLIFGATFVLSQGVSEANRRIDERDWMRLNPDPMTDLAYGVGLATAVFAGGIGLSRAFRPQFTDPNRGPDLSLRGRIREAFQIPAMLLITSLAFKAVDYGVRCFAQLIFGLRPEPAPLLQLPAPI